jgi:membrane protease YdiL (CAAX protease family)
MDDRFGDDLTVRGPSVGPLVRFFALTFAVTWTCFIAAAAVSGGLWPAVPGLAWLRWPLLLVGAFAPSAVAVWLTARADGRAGALALLRRLLAWRVGARWYLFAAGYMAAIKLTVALVHRVATGAWPRFGGEAWYVLLLAMVVSAVVGGPLGEEIGWRGYALPRLAERVGLARASLLLGVIWAGWHLPVFFIPGLDQFGQSFPVYLLQVTALSVAFAWLYGHTNGSLLLAVLFHSAINQSKDIVPSRLTTPENPFALSTSLVAWLTVLLLWVCAGYFLVHMPAAEPKR